MENAACMGNTRVCPLKHLFLILKLFHLTWNIKVIHFVVVFFSIDNSINSSLVFVMYLEEKHTNYLFAETKSDVMQEMFCVHEKILICFHFFSPQY